MTFPQSFAFLFGTSDLLPQRLYTLILVRFNVPICIYRITPFTFWCNVYFLNRCDKTLTLTTLVPPTPIRCASPLLSSARSSASSWRRSGACSESFPVCEMGLVNQGSTVTDNLNLQWWKNTVRVLANLIFNEIGILDTFRSFWKLQWERRSAISFLTPVFHSFTSQSGASKCGCFGCGLTHRLSRDFAWSRNFASGASNGGSGFICTQLGVQIKSLDNRSCIQIYSMHNYSDFNMVKPCGWLPLLLPVPTQLLRLVLF